jgi:1,4-dihydroxy-2-naphthoate octaprenyltransferase
MPVTMKAILGVSRGPFLLLPVVLVASGAAASAYDGAMSWMRTVLALIGLVALHIAVNALNEASDMRTGIDLKTNRTPFSGGSGTLPGGGLSVRFALIYGLIMAAVGLLIGAWFVVIIGWAMAPVLLFAAAAVLAYTDFLLKTGIGELFAGLGLGGLPVIGTALVQDGEIGRAAIAASIPAFLMTFNLLLLNEFPDVEADRAGGRRHLVILLGRRAAAWIYAIAALLTPVAIVIAILIDALPRVALVAILPTLLLAPALRWAFGRTEQPVPVNALAMNVVWNVATNGLLAAGLVVAAWRT